MSKPLLIDLDELVNANVVSTETAGQIENYYRQKKSVPSNRFTVALGILGALLIGTGIILVVAHNWDELSKPIQTIFAFLPMAAGQALCAYALLKRKDDTVWREGSAIFLMMTVASCISLTSQIYQVNGSLSGFLIAWIALSLPLVYLLNASLVSLLIIGLATWYACLEGYGGSYQRSARFPYFYLATLLALAPHYLKQFRSNHNGNSLSLHHWFLSLSVCVTLGAFMPPSFSAFEWVFAAYLALFGLYYLAGTSAPFAKSKLFGNPFLLIGTLGIIVIFLCWSFGWLWEDIGDRRNGGASRSFLFAILPALLIVCWAAAYIFRSNKNKWQTWDIMALSPVVFVAGLLLFRNLPGLGQLLFNAWILALSIFYIRKGAARNHLGILNFGLLIFACLAVIRFFDEDIPFVWRGLIFLLAGAGFVVANSLILKKRKSLAKKTSV